jgi:hypothetical protein
MSDPAPERIEIKSNRVGEFKRELRHLLQDAATGKYDTELRARGVTLPAQIPPDAIEPEVDSSQGVSPDQFVEVLIKYAPLIVPIGRDLWAWAWPKLRDYFDGAARVPKSRS